MYAMYLMILRGTNADVIAHPHTIASHWARRTNGKLQELKRRSSEYHKFCVFQLKTRVVCLCQRANIPFSSCPFILRCFLNACCATVKESTCETDVTFLKTNILNHYDSIPHLQQSIRSILAVGLPWWWRSSWTKLPALLSCYPWTMRTLTPRS